VLPNDEAKPEGWTIGPNRFPTAAQNPLFNVDAFRYPAAFTPGTLGRNTLTGTWINWVQASLSKEFPIRERLKFILRWDVNNPFKTQAFADPDAVFNIQNPVGARTFGRHTETRGSFSDIGGRFNSNLVLRVEW
jgi:hypothetical protein